ncbi:hypothetical protein [Gordonia caeni]|uniref:Uncharacterized protein n=1 Tax=Gordonia caeni TaxID=1007097 RepID=A0ABP7PBE9_9ACTN
MTETPTPKPGEIWITDGADEPVEYRTDGWYWVITGNRCFRQDRTPIRRLVGYTVEHVERLREVLRDLHADVLTEARVERDEAIARAEAAEVALADAACPTLDDIAEHEPWWVLRAAADLAGHACDFDCRPAALRALADELEREHAEKVERDRLVVRATEVYSATMGHETALAAVVDAVLAEAVDQ